MCLRLLAMGTVIKLLSVSAAITHAQEPNFEVVGDAALLELCKDARAANAQLLQRHGSLLAEYEEFHDQNTAPRVRVNVKCSWCGERYLSEFVADTPLAGMPKPASAAQAAEFEVMKKRGVDLDPSHVKGLMDGSRHYLYFTTALTTSGHLQIFRSARETERTLYAEFADQRPAHVWRNSPRLLTWDKWMDLEDRKYPYAMRWEIAREGPLVTARRFSHHVDKGRDEWGILEFAMRLDLAGQVVAYRSGGKSGGLGPQQVTEVANYRWAKLHDGVVVLNDWNYERNGKDYSKRVRYKARELSLAYKSDADFTEKALNVRAGARVDDTISGKTYSYGGRAVTQADLDRLVEKAKGKIRD